MKRLLVIAIILFFLPIIITSNSNSQDKVFENYWEETLPFNFFSGCPGGEAILDLQGEVHRMIQTKLKNNGAVQFITNRNGHLTGVGQDTGKKYNWIVNRHKMETYYPTGLPYSFVNQWQLRIIGQGDAPDLYWTIIEKITIDKNGEVKIDLIDTSYDCK